MPLYELQFNSADNTTLYKNSLQVGDEVYYVEADPNVAGIIASTDPVYLGNVQAINKNGNKLNVTVEVIIPNFIPDTSNFILFSKNIVANESSLKGYYAEITMENNSKKRAELFAISSEVTPSSK
tara:strand:+ start:3746 stop:4120 length:375 start_codon:yes stop_codon:yes gene_type:complete